MIAIIDYGMGNLRSVQKALEREGAQTVITQDPKVLKKADKIVLPGVGAMKPAMQKLETLGLIEPIKEAIAYGKPFLGICLGFQLLFSTSDEGGNAKGLGILPGAVRKFKSLKVPHMGWNQLIIKNDRCAILSGIKNSSDVYFCHSYFVQPKQRTITAATTKYGREFACVGAYKNIFGVQFHPEKSQDIGLKILQNFVNL